MDADDNDDELYDSDEEEKEEQLSDFVCSDGEEEEIEDIEVFRSVLNKLKLKLLNFFF